MFYVVCILISLLTSAGICAMENSQIVPVSQYTDSDIDSIVEQSIVPMQRDRVSQRQKFMKLSQMHKFMSEDDRKSELKSLLSDYEATKDNAISKTEFARLKIRADTNKIAEKYAFLKLANQKKVDDSFAKIKLLKSKIKQASWYLKPFMQYKMNNEKNNFKKLVEIAAPREKEISRKLFQYYDIARAVTPHVTNTPEIQPIKQNDLDLHTDEIKRIIWLAENIDAGFWYAIPPKARYQSEYTAGPIKLDSDENLSTIAEKIEKTPIQTLTVVEQNGAECGFESAFNSKVILEEVRKGNLNRQSISEAVQNKHTRFYAAEIKHMQAEIFNAAKLKKEKKLEDLKHKLSQARTEAERELISKSIETKQREISNLKPKTGDLTAGDKLILNEAYDDNNKNVLVADVKALDAGLKSKNNESVLDALYAMQKDLQSDKNFSYSVELCTANSMDKKSDGHYANVIIARDNGTLYIFKADSLEKTHGDETLKAAHKVMELFHTKSFERVTDNGLRTKLEHWKRYLEFSKIFDDGEYALKANSKKYAYKEINVMPDELIDHIIVAAESILETTKGKSKWVDGYLDTKKYVKESLKSLSRISTDPAKSMTIRIRPSGVEEAGEYQVNLTTNQKARIDACLAACEK